MLFSSRFFLLMLCLAAPTVWCCGQQLHSSTHLDAWVGKAQACDSTDTLANWHRLKEPVIPSDNLDASKASAKDGETAPAAVEVGEEKWRFYESGLASYYSVKVHGRMMASGERYDKNALFCAHKKLPFGTRIRVVNKKNGKEVIVPVKDRGPYSRGRVIDLSNKAAAEIGMLGDGIVQCELWVLDK